MAQNKGGKKCKAWWEGERNSAAGVVCMKQMHTKCGFAYKAACLFEREFTKEKAERQRERHTETPERKRNGVHTPPTSWYRSSSCEPGPRLCVCVYVCEEALWGGLQLSVSGALHSTSCSQLFTQQEPTSWLRMYRSGTQSTLTQLFYFTFLSQ